MRITRDWYAPVGGVLIAGAGFFALLGFPFDDVWHRLFGQDVTLWGPTHLMMIGGAGLSLSAWRCSTRRGGCARAGRARARVTPFGLFVRRGMIMGGLLIGLSVFQGEWDFGVPQFRIVHQPLLIAMAAALRPGRRPAVDGPRRHVRSRWVSTCVVRGGVGVIVGPVFGEPFATIPLYLAEAVCVELAALLLARRPLALGVVSGVLIGTAGFAAEYAWTQVAFTLPWTPDILVEGVLMAVAGGVAGGVAGALLALGPAGQAAPARPWPGRCSSARSSSSRRGSPTGWCPPSPTGCAPR